MAKKKRKKPAAKAAKTAKASARKKVAKKKTAGKKIVAKKTAVAKTRGKSAVAKQSKSVAKKPITKPPVKPAAGTKPAAPPPESLSHKIAGAVGAVVDIFTDAERLHHKLEPGISNEPE